MLECGRLNDDGVHLGTAINMVVVPHMRRHGIVPHVHRHGRRAASARIDAHSEAGPTIATEESIAWNLRATIVADATEHRVGVRMSPQHGWGNWGLNTSAVRHSADLCKDETSPTPGRQLLPFLFH